MVDLEHSNFYYILNGKSRITQNQQPLIWGSYPGLYILSLIMGQGLLHVLVSSCVCVWQAYIYFHKGHMYLFTYCQFLIILDKTHTLKSQHDHPNPQKTGIQNPDSQASCRKAVRQQ